MKNKIKIFLSFISVFTIALLALMFAEYMYEPSAQAPLANSPGFASTTTSTAQPKPQLAPVDFAQLEKDVYKILGKQQKKYGIYIYDLKREEAILINAKKQLPPASISKVPTAILVLRDIDSGKAKLSDTFKIKPKNKPYPYGVMYYYPMGKAVTLKEYLHRSIKASDNTAHWSLEDYLGGHEKVNERTVEELGVSYFFRSPHVATAEDVGTVFKNIYTGSYLSPESNQFLLKLLKNTSDHLQDGIPAKLPPDAVVAHKTGQLPFYVWEDAAIVYGEETDFVLVILNNDITYKTARRKTQAIAKVTYDTLNQ